MELKRLPGGQAKRPNPKLVSKIIHGEVKLVGNLPAWILSAYHERVASGTTLLSIVLLIATMKLDQLSGGFTYIRSIRQNVLVKRISYEIALFFEYFDFAALDSGSFRLRRRGNSTYEGERARGRRKGEGIARESRGGSRAEAMEAWDLKLGVLERR